MPGAGRLTIHAPSTLPFDAAAMPCRLATVPDSRVRLKRESILPDSAKDRSRVSVSQPSEVAFWCAKFGCSETQLRAAVKMVGVTVSKVRAHLAQRK